MGSRRTVWSLVKGLPCPLVLLLLFSGCPGLSISTFLHFTPSIRTTGFQIWQHAMIHIVPVMIWLVQIWDYIHTRVCAFRSLMKSACTPSQIAVCSQFAGDGGSNSWSRGLRINTCLQVCEWETWPCFLNVMWPKMCCIPLHRVAHLTRHWLLRGCHTSPCWSCYQVLYGSTWPCLQCWALDQLGCNNRWWCGLDWVVLTEIGLCNGIAPL